MTRAQVTGIETVATFVALVGLATESLLISLLHWRAGGLVVSLVIAAVKMLLVLWFFMHLREERCTHRLTIFVSLGFVALLVLLTTTDVATRHTFPARAWPGDGERFYER
jgi:cytochrome c oxidase subunit 4